MMMTTMNILEVARRLAGDEALVCGFCGSDFEV